MNKLTVVNKHFFEGDSMYIGRGSPLGNPFKLSPDSRATVIAKYRVYLEAAIDKEQPDIMAELSRIKSKLLMGDVNLACFCAPSACHGDIIKEVVENDGRL